MSLEAMLFEFRTFKKTVKLVKRYCKTKHVQLLVSQNPQKSYSFFL
jgi:hypothetical protein